MLLTTWPPHTQRGARGSTCWAFGDSREDRILGIFREVMAIDAGDGVVFDLDALHFDQMREQAGYGGVCLRMSATVDGTRVTWVVHIGSGLPSIRDLS